MTNLERHKDARRRMVQAVAELAAPADDEASLEARNLIFHAGELMKAVDAFYASTVQAGDDVK